MLGLGVRKDGQLLDGAHLRWFFNPQLGFPKYGFRLFKGYPKYGDKACPSACFSGSLEPWTHFQRQGELVVEKDDLIIRWGERNAIQSDGIVLAIDQHVEVSVPESSKEIRLTIEWKTEWKMKVPSRPKIPIKREPILGKFNTVTDRIRYIDEKFPISDRIILKRPVIDWPIPPIISPPDKGKQPNPVYLDITFPDTGEGLHTTTKPLQEGTNNIYLKADSLNQIKFSLKGDSAIIKENTFLLSMVCWTPVAGCEDFYDWKQIDQTCLPLKDPLVPCTANVSSRQSEWELADERVKLKEPSQRTYDESIFRKEFLPYLKEMIQSYPTPQHEAVKQLSVTESSTGTEHMDPFSLPILDTLLLASMEPEMAQILGLYSLDEHIDDNSHPYKIVGDWHKPRPYKDEAEKYKDMYRLNLAELPMKNKTLSFDKNEFRFLSDVGMFKQTEHGKKGIRVLGVLTVVFPRPLSMILPEIEGVGDTLYIQATRADGTNISSIDEVKMLEEFDQGITGVTISGDFILHCFSYAEMNYAWITHDVGIDSQHNLEAPLNLQGTLLPGKGNPETASSRKAYSYGTVGLSWMPPTPSFEQTVRHRLEGLQIIDVTIKSVSTHVRYKLERGELGKHPNNALPDDQYEWANQGHTIFPTKRPLDERDEAVNYPEGWPTRSSAVQEEGWPPFFYMDVGDKDDSGTWKRFLTKDLWYAYRLYGLDWFGRLSSPGASYKVQIKDTLPPPPPMSLKATYLDPQDPYLEKRELNWIVNENDNRPGYRVQWRWPETFQRQAPDAHHFNLYFHAGRWNVWEGMVQDVSDQGQDSGLKVALERVKSVTADELKGKILRQNNINYRIESHTGATMGSNDRMLYLTVTVKNPSNPKVVPVRNQPISIKLDKDVDGHQDTRLPNVWEDDTASALITSIPVRNGGQFDYFLDQQQLPQSLRLETDAGHPLRFGFFGLSAVDDSGNEGPVAPPLQVVAVHREKPEPPGIADSSQLWATHPDYHSQSAFKITWLITESDYDYFYQVYRVMDQSLMQTDMEQYVQGHLEDNGELNGKVVRGLFDEDSGMDESLRAAMVKDELMPLDAKLTEWEESFSDEKQRLTGELFRLYSSLRNDTWQYLASLEKNATAFAPTSSPLDPMQEQLGQSGGEMAYDDHIEGTGRNRYFYRIGRMDAAGNRSELGLSTLPVAVPDVVPPQAPVLTRAAGKDRQAVLRWRRNSERGMKWYEIYRTTNPAHVKDIRQMGDPVRIDATAKGAPLRVSVLEGQAHVAEATFNWCATVSNVSPIDEQGQSLTSDNWFAGFVRLTGMMSVDEGEMNVVYTDMNGSTQTRIVRGIQGQVKLRIPNGSEPVRGITGIYRLTDADLTNNVYLGICSGAIRLQVEDVEASRGQPLSITYSDQEGADHTVTSLHHEMEMIDKSLEEGNYYYRLVAIREGVIGEDSSGNKQAFELSSYPTEEIKVRVLTLAPPIPPVWKKAQWVKIDNQGQVYEWEDTGSDLTPAILLEWQHGSVSQPVYSIQRKTEESWIWQTVGSELQGDEHYIDVQAEVALSNQYRIRTMSDMETATLTEKRKVTAIEPKN